MEAMSGTTKSAVIFSLLMRTLFFILFGALIVGIFAMAGDEHPLQSAEKWWPYQAILANIATFLVLRSFIRHEGRRYRDLFGFKQHAIGKHLKQFGWLLIVGFALGGIPLYVTSYIFLGTLVPPDLMFQPLPVWAAIVAVVIFPISNGLVETPTYFGYALPRLKALSGKLWVAVVLAGLALAFQHVALPLVADVPYMLWRFTAFIPLAIALGFIYNRTKNLLPIAIAHMVMDLQLILSMFFNSVQ